MGSDEATLHILKAKDGAATGVKEAAASEVSTIRLPRQLGSLMYEELSDVAPASSNRFCRPDPTLVICDGMEYLVLAELARDHTPQLSFYQVSRNRKVASNKAAFRIEGAELLVDCDEAGSISFLTNAALMTRHELSKSLDFTRLTSPSMVVTVDVTRVKELQQMSRA